MSAKKTMVPCAINVWDGQVELSGFMAQALGDAAIEMALALEGATLASIEMETPIGVATVWVEWDHEPEPAPSRETHDNVVYLAKPNHDRKLRL